ncbi:hypothetical protein OSB04_008168 [Centaurea solstitialis]|uniref:Uncharacterized protein n=1 Tax=Centaurea solstitialis TaxID=347529 RepID=A0AA38TL95_9ASTR|nr:hypothetical protein OSB04_008168 [Centaurea solstitialis]
MVELEVGDGTYEAWGFKFCGGDLMWEYEEPFSFNFVSLEHGEVSRGGKRSRLEMPEIIINGDLWWMWEVHTEDLDGFSFSVDNKIGLKNFSTMRKLPKIV